jgi:hypothetical protein
MNASLLTRLAVIAGLGCGCASDADDDSDAAPGTSASALVAICATAAQTPVGAWRCGETRTVECSDPQGTPVDWLYAPPRALDADAGEGTCEGTAYFVDNTGPFTLGSHDIAVQDGDTTVCRAHLIVDDTQGPRAEVRVVELWPGNHKMHHFTPADCVTVRDACEGELPAYFTFATVDEAADVNGAGAKGEVDVEALDCDGVDLRAERAGGETGRTYTLGWFAEDHAGHRTEGTCRVVVPHDQGHAMDMAVGAEVVRFEAPAACPR